MFEDIMKDKESHRILKITTHDPETQLVNTFDKEYGPRPKKYLRKIHFEQKKGREDWTCLMCGKIKQELSLHRRRCNICTRSTCNQEAKW
jgi:hypothetical protein